ncbi:MAG: low temperature requirement protein A [Solirubrobacteraceae bacterium]
MLAVAQLAHLIVAEPAMRSVWIAPGLFFTLWWTWVGFAVLYNRLGADEPVQRLLFLAANVPIGVAAVAIGPASTGDSTVFALSLAAARLVLAGAHAVTGDGRSLLRERITQACLAPRPSSRSPRPCPSRCATRCGRSRSASSPARCSPRTVRRRAGCAATTTCRRCGLTSSATSALVDVPSQVVSG